MATEIRPQRNSVARENGNDLGKQGLSPRGRVHWNLIAPELFQAAARREEGEFADMGPFVAVTTPHTGRSPNDKFVVREEIGRATSELQSPMYLVCRLLLEKKKNKINSYKY